MIIGKIIASLLFLTIGVLLIYLGVKILMLRSVIDDFHRQVEEEYRPQIAELNETVEDAYATLQDFNEVIASTHKLFTKLLNIFFKDRKVRRKKH